MRQRLTLPKIIPGVVVPLVAVLAIAGCGSSSKSSGGTGAAASGSTGTTASSATTVKTASTKLGTVLVNSSGMTLYHLTVEKSGKFICTNSPCTGIWHPLTTQGGQAPTGVSSLSTVQRPDGQMQVTYKGEPLYTFVQDKSAGDTKGQGVKDVGTWKVITVKGSAPAAKKSTPAPAPAPSTSTSSGGSGGYGY